MVKLDRSADQSWAEGVYSAVVLARPWLSVIAALLFTMACGYGLKNVSKDPSVDAFVPAGHPASLARDAANELFGLEDPIVVALAVPKGDSVFTPAGLMALKAMHESVRTIDQVKKNDVISLASERAISGLDGDLLVEDIFGDGPVTASGAQQAWARVQSMPMMLGFLASETGDMVTLIIPVENPNQAESVSADVLRAVTALTPAGYDVHMAGVAAMNARLAGMVSADTKKFIPATVLTVLVFLGITLGRLKAILGPFLVIAGSAACAVGILGWAGAHYYLITTALPVVIMAIAVADSLHITAFYLAARQHDPACSARDAAAFAFAETGLGVTLTTVTTMAGFLGLALGAAMVPISEFGLFAAAGVFSAWFLSLVLLPAVMVLLDLQPRRQSARGSAQSKGIAKLLQSVTQIAVGKPGRVVGILGAIMAGFIVFAVQAEFDYERKRYFQPDDSVRIADEVMSDRLGGLNFLDVVISADEPGGLMTVRALNALEALAKDVAALPYVVKVSGIHEYVAVMHEALTGAAPGTLPQRGGAPAQYMFLYEASAPPDDFKRQIDYDQQHLLLRAQLSTDQFQATAPVVENLSAIVDAWSAQSGFEAQISGRVAVNDGWMSLLAHNHFIGLSVAVGLVFLAALVTFRSIGPAVLVMVPVATGVLFIYAVMGLFKIDIAPATSMMAAISTGLGVDFGVHLIAHARRNLHQGSSVHGAFNNSYLLVARACLYSAMALSAALLVLCLSAVPVLQWFGLLIATGAIGSLVGALFIIPACFVLGATRFQRKSPSHA